MELMGNVMPIPFNYMLRMFEAVFNSVPPMHVAVKTFEICNCEARDHGTNEAWGRPKLPKWNQFQQQMPNHSHHISITFLVPKGSQIKHLEGRLVVTYRKWREKWIYAVVSQWDGIIWTFFILFQTWQKKFVEVRPKKVGGKRRGTWFYRWIPITARQRSRPSYQVKSVLTDC